MTKPEQVILDYAHDYRDTPMSEVRFAEMLLQCVKMYKDAEIEEMLDGMHQEALARGEVTE